MDGGDSLIAHSITLPVCLERQRGLYHKCFTCAHRGAGASAPKTEVAPLPEPGPAQDPAPTEGAPAAKVASEA